MLHPFQTKVHGEIRSGVCGAAMLARAGWDVCVLERNASLGGNICTEELTLPGFRHDVLAGWHPLFLGSAGYSELASDLHQAGLEYLNTDYPTAALLDDGRGIFLSTSEKRNMKEFDEFSAGAGSAWMRVLSEFAGEAEIAFGLLGTELWSRHGLSLLWGAFRQFGKQALSNSEPSSWGVAGPGSSRISRAQPWERCWPRGSCILGWDRMEPVPGSWCRSFQPLSKWEGCPYHGGAETL